MVEDWEVHGESATVVGAVFENWGRGEGKNEEIVERNVIQKVY